MNDQLELAISTYYAGAVCATPSGGWERFIPASVREHLRNNRTCAHCRQRIDPDVAHVVRGIQTFHKSCAARFESHSAIPAARATAPAVLGTLCGSAGELFNPAGCAIFSRDVVVDHETFRAGALDASIRSNEQFLSVHHEDHGLRGRFLFICEDARCLIFAFELHEGQRERDVLARVRVGDARGCSIRFQPDPALTRFVGPRGTAREYGAARLIEISICFDRWPSWYGSFVRAIA